MQRTAQREGVEVIVHKAISTTICTGGPFIGERDFLRPNSLLREMSIFEKYSQKTFLSSFFPLRVHLREAYTCKPIDICPCQVYVRPGKIPPESKEGSRFML